MYHTLYLQYHRDKTAIWPMQETVTSRQASQCSILLDCGTSWLWHPTPDEWKPCPGSLLPQRWAQVRPQLNTSCDSGEERRWCSRRLLNPRQCISWEKGKKRIEKEERKKVDEIPRTWMEIWVLHRNGRAQHQNSTKLFQNTLPRKTGQHWVKKWKAAVRNRWAPGEDGQCRTNASFCRYRSKTRTTKIYCD